MDKALIKLSWFSLLKVIGGTRILTFV